MQEISLMNKIIHWLLNDVVVKKRDIRITSYFVPLVKGNYYPR